MRDAARRYAQRGWSVLPVPHQSKNPGFRGWQELRLSESDLPDHFNGKPQNIGVLLGEPSGWLIDVDLDHPRAVELAQEFLPPTPAVFGRKSKPRSHWLYRASGPVATKKHKSKSAGMIVELRSTGAQTVFPPSTHESGEPIIWDDESAEPAIVEPEALVKAVQELAMAVRVEIGEKAPPKTKPKPPKQSKPVETAPLGSDERFRNCIAAMRRMRIEDHNDGSGRLYAAACRAVEHGLSDPDAIAAIREYAREKPFPRDWTDAELIQRLRDAKKVCESQLRDTTQPAGLVPLGGHDPNTGRLVLSPKKTLPTAEAFVREFQQHAEGRTLHSYAGLLLRWKNNRFVEIEEEAVKNILQTWLHRAMRYVLNRSTDELELIEFDSNPGTIKAALDSIRFFTHLPVTVLTPSWLVEDSTLPKSEEILPCLSTLLHIPTMTRLDPTPVFFTTSALDFDPDPHAPRPMNWLRFLHELFEDDIESQDLLQDWFGYCLTGNTSLQKMLLIVGPRRSGKGTIARILARLIGDGNVCGPTTSSLAGTFGLQPLIGKTLAIVSDARFSGENIATVVERLLCISGEDALTIDRKFLSSVTMKLPTRFTFLTNELPRLSDASGALAGRFVILRTTQSFFGKEDPALTEKLLLELPGILNWAIEGWHRLKDRGRFVMPQSVEDAVQDMEDLSSPVGAVVRDECIVEPGLRIDAGDLYQAWERWCERDGRDRATTRQRFGRDLAAAVPGVICRRGTNNVRFYMGISLRRPF
jgi:putative DNA primase/helicase